MKRLVATSLMSIALAALPSIVSAATILLTFRGVDGSLSFNGGPFQDVDLTVQLLANTDDLLPGAGVSGSDRYPNLTARFSSVGLGLSNVAAIGFLSVDIGTPLASPPFRNQVILTDGVVTNGLFGNPAIITWDRVSSIGPLSMVAVSSIGPLNVTLASGDTLSVVNLDNARPFGDASFEATVPEPSGLWLLAIGALIVALCRSRS